MRRTIILTVLFAVTLCDLIADLANLFNRKCNGWNEMRNKDVVNQLKINKTVKQKPEGGGEEEDVNVSYPVKYYCALTQVARLAQQFNVTGLVQFHRPMKASLPTEEVVKGLTKVLAGYKPVAEFDEHFPIGCDMGVRSYRKIVPQKKKNKKKKKQKKRFITVTEYDAYCVALTSEFVDGVLGKIVDGSATGDIKIILDALNRQE